MFHVLPNSDISFMLLFESVEFFIPVHSLIEHSPLVSHEHDHGFFAFVRLRVALGSPSVNGVSEFPPVHLVHDLVYRLSLGGR